MKPYYLDTSLMLRLLTGDPPELAAQALEVFRGAEEGRYTLAVHPLAVAEAFYTLVSFYGVGRAEAAGALLDLLDREGVLLEDEEDLRPALEEAGKGGLSLVDAFLAQRARRQGAGLATLDRKLRRRAGVELLP
ncbi:MULTISPECIES: PIN domain-containing protein [Thermus]|uniref:PIN domain-containing protein n=1 Tax=Thermus TaxID=270 RepID=UPI001FD0EF23|nr:PIN domain-containing protein [Thermus parvatiensis]